MTLIYFYIIYGNLRLYTMNGATAYNFVANISDESLN